MATPPRIIFFDLDETLIVNAVGPGELVGRIYAEHLAHLGTGLEPRFGEALFETASSMWEDMFEPGRSGRAAMVETFRRAAEAIGGDGSLGEPMFRRFVQISSRGTRLSANALPVLEALRVMGIATGIITNGIDALQRAKIEAHGLQRRVDAVVISENAGAHKPDRRVFEHALALAGRQAADAWHVGDHLVNDIAGAIDAGMTAVHYHPGGPAARAGDAAADSRAPHHVIRDLAELLRLLG